MDIMDILKNLGIIVGIIVCTMVVGNLFDSLFGSPLRRLGKYSQVLLFLLGLAVLGIYENGKNKDSNLIETVQQATQIDSETNSTSASLNSTTETDYSSTEESSATEQSRLSGISLLDLGYVEEPTIKSKYLYENSIQANADVFNQALVSSCHCVSSFWETCEDQCKDSAVQLREYSLGGKYSRLEAKLVVLDSSSGTHTVRIFDDNGLNELYTIEPGDTKDISVDVSGVTRLKIEFTNLSVADGIAEGEEFVNTGIALADPILTQ